MNKILKSKIKNHFLKMGINYPTFIKEIKEGRNSNIFLYKHKQDKFVVKLYKSLQRLKREKLFYDFLRINELKSVPELLSSNNKYKIIIFRHINGKKVNKISNDDLKELILFLKNLNCNKFNNLPLAIDGIKDRKNHLNLCQKIINDLKLINDKTPINRIVIKFLNQNLLPQFELIKKNIMKKKFQTYLKRIDNKNLIVSPSDLGFHNILKYKKKLYFYDFEYAGLDDPIKLICDFICQPDQKLSTLQKNKFINNKLFFEYNIQEINFLVKLFLPLHQIKWCCIMLNEFRFTSKSKIKLTSIKKLYLKKQFDKTVKYYYKHFRK